jgi:hypothetical protein
MEYPTQPGTELSMTRRAGLQHPSQLEQSVIFYALGRYDRASLNTKKDALVPVWHVE